MLEKVYILWWIQKTRRKSSKKLETMESRQKKRDRYRKYEATFLADSTTFPFTFPNWLHKVFNFLVPAPIHSSTLLPPTTPCCSSMQSYHSLSHLDFINHSHNQVTAELDATWERMRDIQTEMGWRELGEVRAKRMKRLKVNGRMCQYASKCYHKIKWLSYNGRYFILSCLSESLWK